MYARLIQCALVIVLVAAACTTTPSPPSTTLATPASSPTATPVASAQDAIPASATIKQLRSPLAPRINATGVWTGSEVILWGGWRWEDLGVSGPLADGARYDPAGDNWRMLSDAPIDPKAEHIAGWTGKEMLVWGGNTGGDTAPAVATGAAYNPTTSRWRTLAQSPVSWAEGAAAVWAGEEWVIAVAPDGANAIEVAAYDPNLDRWRELPRLPGPFSSENQLVWTGSELLLVNLADGLFRLDPDKGAWIRIATPSVWGSVVWTGNRLLGVAKSNPYWSLVEWDPSTDLWSDIAMPESALLREPELVWTGDRAIFPDAGLAFDPATRRWWSLDPAATFDRSDSVVLWAGDRVVMMGGWHGGPSAPIPFGEAYIPAW